MDCYEEILKFFTDKKRNEEITKKWCDDFIIKLMRGNYTQLQTKNSLLLILNLFNNHQPDTYHKEGRLINELSNNEKEMVRKMLRVEVFD